MTSLLLIIALGCTDDETTLQETGADSAPVDSATGDTVGDSGEVIDSGDSGSDSADTADTAPPLDVGVLQIYPQGLVVDPGASWPLRSVHSLDGASADVAPAWTSSDETVLTVSVDGVATAISAGEATLTATLDTLVEETLVTLVADALVTVQDEPRLKIHLVHADSGLPVTDGKVFCNGETFTVDEISGNSVIDLPSGEPLWLTAWDQGGRDIPATLLDVVGRDLTLPLRKRGQANPNGELDGTFDFSALPPLSDDEKAAGYVILGIAGGTLGLGPLFWRAEEVLAPNRDVEIYGLEIRVPGNLAIQDAFETWVAPAWSGDIGVWSMAGPVPLADAIVGLDNLDDALDFLLANIDGFLFGFVGTLEVPADVPLSVEVRPETSLSTVVQVDLPEWPTGFTGADTAMLVVLDGDGPEGPAVVGLGRGFSGTTYAGRAPGAFFDWDESDAQVLAYLETGGIGTLGAKVLSAAPVVDGVATIGPFQDPPSLTLWDRDTRTLELAADPDVHLVHLYGLNNQDEEWDVYLPSSSTGAITIPADGPDFDWARRLHWELAAIETTVGTYESLLAEGAIPREQLKQIGRTTGFVNELFRKDTSTPDE